MLLHFFLSPLPFGGSTVFLLADQRGIEPPPAVCQRHKSAAIPTAPRGRRKKNRSAFASPTERQDPGEHRCWFKVSSPAYIMPIFACCRLSQHGWVRCWFCCDIAGGMLFSAFALAVDHFVTIGRCTAQFCFGLLIVVSAHVCLCHPFCFVVSLFLVNFWSSWRRSKRHVATPKAGLLHAPTCGFRALIYGLACY